MGAGLPLEALRQHGLVDVAGRDVLLDGPHARLEDLARQMKAARFGIIFFGMGLSMTRGKHMNSAAILMLAAEMNAFTKFVAMPMRGHGNVTGADVIMRWQTGFPFGIATKS